jgi:beta-N-acetylhexosaminidase
MPKYTGSEFIIMGVPGETLDKATEDLIRGLQPAGFILFKRNINGARQLRALTDSLRKLVDHEPFMALDQEGGRVSRLGPLLTTQPVSPGHLRRHGDKKLMKRQGALTGKLCKLFGFNLNLAPVLDIEIKPDKHLEDRCFGITAEEATVNAAEFIKGMHSQGLLSCGKHFPGYTAATVDPHLHLPLIERHAHELHSMEWIPFRELSCMLDMIMTAHAKNPILDPSGKPASLSPLMVRKVLRDEWHYDGCLVTDDIDMGAIRNHYGTTEAAVMAFEAGNDLVLVCHSIDKVEEIANTLAKLPHRTQEESYGRILQLRQCLVAPSDFAPSELRRLDAQFEKMHTAVVPAK